jgi:maleate isomerase
MDVGIRVGLIIPSVNQLTESHMHAFAPDGVEVHVTRLRMTGASHVPLSELMPRIREATLALDDAGCDAIVFHCTAASMEAGLVGERQVLDTMGSVTRAHTATTATATLAALQTINARRIALFSPYIAATHQHEIDFLAEAGVEVIGGRCLGLEDGKDFIQVTPEDWLRMAQEETSAEADAVFLSCTNIRAPEIIEPLERALARPVVSSNQAVLWYVLRACGSKGQVQRLGALMCAPAIV